MMRRGMLVVGVSAFGFALDVSIALLLRQAAGLPLALAGAMGFAVAAVANYFAFEFVVFRSVDSCVDPARLVVTLLSSLAALGVRVVAIAALVSSVAPTGWVAEGAVLLIAASLSLAVNFVLLRFFAFRGR